MSARANDNLSASVPTDMRPGSRPGRRIAVIAW